MHQPGRTVSGVHGNSGGEFSQFCYERLILRLVLIVPPDVVADNKERLLFGRQAFAPRANDVMDFVIAQDRVKIGPFPASPGRHRHWAPVD